MELSVLENHKYIKLIEFSLENKNFTGLQACSFSGLSKQEFDFVKSEIYILSGAQVDYYSEIQPYDWKLTSQAFFNYLQFSEFKFAVSSAKKAQHTAHIAIVISVVLALSSLLIA